MSLPQIHENMKNQEMNEQLTKENQKLKVQLQAEREASTRHTQEMMNQLRLQEQLLSEKNAQIELLSGENERLLKLAENEKKLYEENEKLKQEKEMLLKKENSKDRRIRELEAEIETLSDKVSKITNRLPSVEKIENFAYAIERAGDAVKSTHIINYITWTALALFLVVAGFCGYQAMEANQNAKNAYYAILDGVFNKVENQYWSVIEGSQSYERHKESVNNEVE